MRKKTASRRAATSSPRASSAEPAAEATSTTGLVATTPSDREIRTERVFDAPRARVWQALTAPGLLARWWGRGNPLTIEQLEPVDGGRWRFVENAPEGSHGFEGRYREVTPPEGMVQTFSWDGAPGHVSVVTTVLEELEGGRTRLVSTSLFHTEEERDGMLASGMTKGLSASYAALDRVLAAPEDAPTVPAA